MASPCLQSAQTLCSSNSCCPSCLTAFQQANSTSSQPPALTWALPAAATVFPAWNCLNRARGSLPTLLPIPCCLWFRWCILRCLDQRTSWAWAHGEKCAAFAPFGAPGKGTPVSPSPRYGPHQHPCLCRPCGHTGVPQTSGWLHSHAAERR